MSATISTAETHLGLVDKLRFLVALAAAAALFLSVGWMATAPADPLGAVSLLEHQRSMLMVLEVAALVAVIAALATLLIGAKLPDVGVFTAGFGMALVSLRGDTATQLLMTALQPDGSGERALAGKLMVECLFWFAAILVGLVVSGWVTRFCLAPSGEPGDRSARFNLLDMGASECPFVRRWVVGDAPGADKNPPQMRDLRITIVTAIVAAMVYAVFVSGTSPERIEHGQVCFAVFAAYYLGSWVAKSLFPVRTVFWHLLSIPVACVVHWVVALFRAAGAGAHEHLATVPACDFLRALPMTYVGVAVVGVLTAHWVIAESGEKEHAER